MAPLSQAPKIFPGRGVEIAFCWQRLGRGVWTFYIKTSASFQACLWAWNSTVVFLGNHCAQSLWGQNTMCCLSILSLWLRPKHSARVFPKCHGCVGTVIYQGEGCFWQNRVSQEMSRVSSKGLSAFYSGRGGDCTSCLPGIVEHL